jgi:integrase
MRQDIPGGRGRFNVITYFLLDSVPDLVLLGWHSFRHSYSTLLRSLQADLKVQQELLWHSVIRTTMNICTQAVPDAMRETNSKVVEMFLPRRKVG